MSSLMHVPEGMACFGFREIQCIAVYCWYHVTCFVGYYCVWVGCCVVKKLFYFFIVF